MSENQPSPETHKSTLIIERALPDDAETICDIRDRAWLEAYPNEELGITTDDIRLMAQGPEGVYVQRRIAYMKQQFAETDPGSLGTFVAKADGQVVGYTEVLIENGQKFISAMYVAPEVQKTGAGGALMRKALEVLGRDEDIYLEVVAYNQNAIGFYEHFGFEVTNIEVPKEEGRPEYLKTLPKVMMVLRANTEAT